MIVRLPRESDTLEDRLTFGLRKIIAVWRTRSLNRYVAGLKNDNFPVAVDGDWIISAFVHEQSFANCLLVSLVYLLAETIEEISLVTV